jgi:hypothetical protein
MSLASNSVNLHNYIGDFGTPSAPWVKTGN